MRSVQMNPEYLSTIEAAKRLQVATGTIQKMVDTGILNAWKTSGGHRRILLESIEAFERNQRKQKRKETNAPSDQTLLGNKASGKLLIIEDSHFFAGKLKEFIKIEIANIDIDISYNAFEAVHLVANQKYDALILDMKMPGFDGFSFLSQLGINYPGLIGSTIILTELEVKDVKDRLNVYKPPAILHKSNFEDELLNLLKNIFEQVKIT